MEAATAETRARLLHRQGLELMRRGRPADGARLLRSGLRSLGWSSNGDALSPEHSASAARLLISLAMAEVDLGHADEGFGLLDTAERWVAPAQRGVLVQQRGAMLVLVGRVIEARRCLDEAIELLSQSDEQLVLARTLLNRAVRHQNAGHVTPARLDLVRCERIARLLGERLLLAKATQCHGYCDLLSGDVPAALRHFDAAADGYLAASAHPLLGGLSVHKARALLTAGLYWEAAAELDTTIARLGRRWSDQARAEAELARAQAALACGDWAAARSWARRAERRFRRHANAAWAATAALTRLQADFRQRRALPATSRIAGQLAEELRARGLDSNADAAALLAARAHVATGQTADAAAMLGRCRTHTVVENRIQRRLARAELAAAAGDHRSVLRHCRLGLTVLGRHQSRFGSLDLRTGSAAIGLELANLGLEAALTSGSAALTYSWLERSRAQSFRVYPVRPPSDQRVAAAVAELRQLTDAVRRTELAGDRDPAARRRCTELERAIRAQDWKLDGSGERRALARFGAVVAELAESGSALVTFMIHRGRLLGLVVTGRGGSLHPLGGWAGVAESVTRLHHDIDMLCTLELPAALDVVIRGSALRQAKLLGTRLIAPLLPRLGERRLVLVPTATMSAIPWNALPELHGRPVTVAPSASTWLDGRRARSRRPAGAPPLLVAGPELTHAVAEVRAIARIYSSATVLDGTAATIAKTLQEMDGRPVVHIAAHGQHQQNNVLFSSLRLADGPLMAYDLQRLSAAPQHVVLPACDVGRAIVRARDELLGFTAALLYLGTISVVSCVSRVLDQYASDVMSAYHSALVAGRSPAEALAQACTPDQLPPFVCFGAG